MPTPHRFAHCSVVPLPIRPADVVAEFLHTDSPSTDQFFGEMRAYRARAAEIAAQDAVRRAIVGKPCK